MVLGPARRFEFGSVAAVFLFCLIRGFESAMGELD